MSAHLWMWVIKYVFLSFGWTNPLNLKKMKVKEKYEFKCAAAAHTHTTCTNAYHTPLERHMHTQTLQSHWFIGSAYTCGLTELLTLLTTAEVKTGFKVPAKLELAAHLRRVGWPEPWHTIRGAYTPDTITHTANGQCNWAEQFYRRCSVLYGKFLMHHFAYINISLPIVSSPESVLLEPHVQSSSPLFLTRLS